MLSIVVPIYRERREVLKSCLDSLRINKTEVIVVEESKGTNRSLVRLAKSYGYQIISTTKKGVCAARNCGWKAAENEWIFFLDADEYLSENFVDKIKPFLLKYMRSQDIGALCVDEKRVVTTFVSRIREVYMSRYTKQMVPRIFKRQVLEELHGFDEDLYGAEDMDLRDRLLKRYRMKNVPLQYSHIQMQTFREFMASNTWYGKDYIRSIKKLPKDTIIFYGTHCFYLFPLFSLFFHVLIVPWIIFEIVNVGILFTRTRNFHAFLVPVFDFLKALFVYLGLITQRRIT